jgi:hypothetical protein
VGNPTIEVSKYSISSSFSFPIDGERWFKKKNIPEEICNQFLIEDHQHLDWSKGIPSNWLKEEWRNILVVVQNFITC